MRYEKLLQRMGFTPNEAKVYLANLETGLASAQTIAKVAGLERTTTYSVLGSLVSRGLIAKSKVRNKSRFLAEPPAKIKSLANEMVEEITKAMPELEAIANSRDKKPKITFFEGKHAINRVYEDTLEEKPKEILEWNTDAYFERFPISHGYIDKRVKLGIRARRIAGTGSRWDTEHKRFDKGELSETVIVPREQFWPEIEVNIYGNKVAFMNYAEEMSVIIESRPIAEAMRQAYELSWHGGKLIERQHNKN